MIELQVWMPCAARSQPAARRLHRRPVARRRAGAALARPAAQLSRRAAVGQLPAGAVFQPHRRRPPCEWQGTQHPLVRNNGDEPHAIHGVGWQRPWEVLDSDGRFAHAGLRAPGRRGLALRLRQLADPAPDAAGAGVDAGAHQPVAAAGAGGPGLAPVLRQAARQPHLRSQATGRWEMGDGQAAHARAGPRAGWTPTARFLDVDHCFDGWNGVGRVCATSCCTCASRSSLSGWWCSPTPTRDFVAIEPVSHVNNAVNLVGRRRRRRGSWAWQRCSRANR